MKTPSFSVAASVRTVRSARRMRSTKAATACSCGVPAARLSVSGCSGARTMNVAPKSVSGRVVKMRTLPPRSRAKSTSAPTLFPIQLDCMVRTRSGQPDRVSMSRSSSSA